MRPFIFLMMQCGVVMSASCPGDMNKDHRPRVSCVGQNLTAVPDGIQPDTQVLVLTQNHFSSLSWSSYSGFTQLHELDLSHNHITTLEPPGPVLENLSVLRLSGNRLTGLGGLVFRCAPNLMEIYLDGNQIRSLHDATFSELPRLEIINLSQNKLPALPLRLLERVSSSGLKTFDLENNSVSLMPDGFFSSKPELPYVFLSYNPWICSCAVGYLHSYLNDQEHNVYKHDGPNDIIPAADTVVCSGPPHLFQRPIIELEENDFCPPDPPLYPSGDLDFHSSSTRILVKPISTPQSPNAPHDTTTITHLPTSTKTWTSTGSWVTVEDVKWFDFWTTPSSSPVTFLPDISTSPPSYHRDTTESLADTQHTMSESPTTGPNQSTGQLDPHTSMTTITVHTKPPTVGSITTRSQLQSTTPPEPHTWIVVQTELPTAERITARTEPPTSVGPHWADARDVDGRMLPWCWWLFAGFVLLCVLSALTSCFLFLWLLRNYLTIYRRLKRHSLARLASDGVILRAYRCAENTQTRENEGESVSFLALEQIKDVQAVFRSVLFINQREEQYGASETERKDVSSKIEAVSVADEARDKEQEPLVSGEVFRKTLYRVISQEEEADGWREEEERWVQSREGTTARYSLILREDRGRQQEMQWVVGEWELAEGGVAYQRSCSLIGQPSTIALE
ncbi:platelet glycoprotein Ib alpha chain [Chanodichthys erythropterus]|uniref:platelet glycoprotein Ib alpha chain n=1 Tax=Chanodichthys erythropterus TaxID=933992 RepID=UPI00351F7EF7